MTEISYTLSSPVTDDDFARYFYFRWQQLREPLNLPSGSEKDQLDSQAYQRMALLSDRTIIGVGRIHLDTPGSAQLRYMAIDSNFQRCGIGSRLLSDLLLHAKKAGAELCWLNARETACTFYQSQGFTLLHAIDSSLNIPHYKMQKHLR